MEEEEDDKLLWVIIACSFRLLLEEIINNIVKGKIKIQCSSILTPFELESRLRRIDKLITALIPQPLHSLETIEEKEPWDKNKKGKKLNSIGSK